MAASRSEPAFEGVEVLLDFAVERRLVVLHCEQVVRPLVGDDGSDVSLAPHGVGGDDAAVESQTFKQHRNGANLVGLFLGGDLAQDEPIGGGPSADEMKRAFALGAAVAHSLPVDRDHLTDFKSAKGGYPRAEAALEGFWVQSFENPPIRVLGRSPTTHIQESPEPSGLKGGKVGDGSEGLLAAGNADDGRNQHVDEGVPEVSPGFPQVIQILEKIAERAKWTLGGHP